MDWLLVAEIALGITIGGLGVILLLTGAGWLYSLHYDRKSREAALQANAEARQRNERRAQRVAERKAREAETMLVEASQEPARSRFEVMVDKDRPL